ncbi:MAG: phage terminase large subunit, partial [Hyphomicrobiales bacterium]|nr:phage terminase large subunit [Hyphomicrobiales bacterium]
SSVTGFKPEGDKIMRLHAQTATIENGFVHLPEEAHWLADYISELTMFPAGRHDDQVDSTAQALAWTKLRPPGWGIIEFYRMECERLKAPQPEPKVRLLAPEGVSHVQGLSGRQYVVRERTVEVDGEDARPLLRAGFRTNPWQIRRP